MRVCACVRTCVRVCVCAGVRACVCVCTLFHCSALLSLHHLSSLSPPPSAQNQPIGSYDQTVVLLLCEWAITPQRRGPHRALTVARLLRIRDTQLRKSEVSPSRDMPVGILDEN